MKTLLTLGTVSLLFFILISGFKKNENTVNTVDVGVVVSDLKRSLEFFTPDRELFLRIILFQKVAHHHLHQSG